MRLNAKLLHDFWKRPQTYPHWMICPSVALTEAQFWTKSIKQEKPYPIPITAASASKPSRPFSSAGSAGNEIQILGVAALLGRNWRCCGVAGAGSHAATEAWERSRQSVGVAIKPPELFTAPIDLVCMAIVFIYRSVSIPGSIEQSFKKMTRKT
jgi:hypothetical protein